MAGNIKSCGLHQMRAIGRGKSVWTHLKSCWKQKAGDTQVLSMNLQQGNERLATNEHTIKIYVSCHTSVR